jgi:hypothetical protein
MNQYHEAKEKYILAVFKQKAKEIEHQKIKLDEAEKAFKDRLCSICPLKTKSTNDHLLQLSNLKDTSEYKRWKTNVATLDDRLLALHNLMRLNKEKTQDAKQKEQIKDAYQIAKTQLQALHQERLDNIQQVEAKLASSSSSSFIDTNTGT